MAIRRSIVWCVLAGVPVTWLPTAGAVDQVIRYSTETTVRGDVTKMNRTGITVERAGGEIVEVPADDLRDLRLDGEPPDLQRARSSEESGVWDSALEKLKVARDTNTSLDRRIAAEIDFLTARCLARQALSSETDGNQALQALDSFRSANDTNVRYYESILWLARLHSAAGQSVQALGLLKETEDSGVPGFALQSQIVRGQLFLQSGEGEQALQAFDGAMAISQGNDAMIDALRDARIGRALSLHQLTRSDEAAAELDALIRELPESSSSIVARLWNHKGDILRATGQARGALLAYLHVDILYANESAAHAEALFHLAELWQTAGHADRARDAAARLKQHHPDSPWAAKVP